jgi:hypothetical protein
LIVILKINLTILFYYKGRIKIFKGIIYIFIIVKELITRGIIIETAMKIKRKVLRKIIAIIETISY